MRVRCKLFEMPERDNEFVLLWGMEGWCKPQPGREKYWYFTPDDPSQRPNFETELYTVHEACLEFLWPTEGRQEVLKVQIGYREWHSTKTGMEVDFGMHWSLFRNSTTPWRVSWIATTGELYAADPIRDRYIYLGTYTGDRVRARMDGWERSSMVLEEWFQSANDSIEELFT